MRNFKLVKMAGVLASIPASFLVAGAVNAEDWSTVTGGIDFSGEITGVMAIVGVLAGFFVVRKGARLLLSMLK